MTRSPGAGSGPSRLDRNTPLRSRTRWALVAQPDGPIRIFRLPRTGADRRLVWSLDSRFAHGSRQPDNEPFAYRRYPVKTFSAVIERDPETGLFVGFVPGFRGAHSQGATLDELNANLREVISMLLEDGDPVLESEFVGVQTVAVA